MRGLLRRVTATPRLWPLVLAGAGEEARTSRASEARTAERACHNRGVAVAWELFSGEKTSRMQTITWMLLLLVGLFFTAVPSAASQTAPLESAAATQMGNQGLVLQRMYADGDSVTISTHLLLEDLAAADEVWLVAVGTDLSEKLPSVAIRWKRGGGWFPRWYLQFAALPGVLAARYVDGSDKGLEYVELGPVVSKLTRYQATLSYSAAAGRVSVSLEEVGGEGLKYSTTLCDVAQIETAAVGCGLFGETAAGDPSFCRNFRVVSGYQTLGPLFELGEGFQPQLCLVQDGDVVTTQRYRFYVDEQVALRLPSPEHPVPGVLRAVLEPASAEEHEVFSLPGDKIADVNILPPLEDLPKGAATLRLEHVDHYGTHVISEMPLEILANRVSLFISAHGRNGARDPGNPALPPSDCGLFGTVAIVPERPLQQARLRLYALFAPGAVSWPEGEELAGDRAERTLVLDERISVAAGRREEVPFALRLPPARGIVRFEALFDEPGMEVILPEDRVRICVAPMVPAFRGAEGWGMYSIGGRGGKVYAVTNLNDDGPGSLREAIEAEGPRTVVFHVSGTIELQSDLVVKNPYLTIAGQTAPGDGITLKNFPLRIQADHVIVRFLRIRLGPVAEEDLDGIEVRDADHVIIDHVSVSWTVDEGFNNWHGSSNQTLQWSIIAEPLHDSVHSKGAHGFAASVGGPNFSMHHNLIANAAGRAPSLAGPVRMDFRNNVIYNWGHRSIDGGVGSINIVGNYFKPGPATMSSVRRRIVEVEKPEAAPAGKYYVAGNVVEGFPDISANNWQGGVDFEGDVDVDEVKAAQPIAVPPVLTQPAEKACELVLGYAGTTLPQRDPVDCRIVREIREGVATYGDGIIDSPSEVGGWPILSAGTPLPDTDRDGLPDEWEKKRGLDPVDPSDGAFDRDGDGYSNLEEYLDKLAESAFPEGYLQKWEQLHVLQTK